MRRTQRWSKERSLWWLEEVQRKGKTVHKTWPYMAALCLMIAFLLWFLKLSMIDDKEGLSFWAMTIGLYVTMPGVWVLHFLSAWWMLDGYRGDWVFLRKYKRKRRQLSLDPEFMAEVERVYNESRKMSAIWLPPQKFPYEIPHDPAD